VVNSVNDSVGGNTFLPKNDSILTTCNNTTLIFLFTPLEQHWGKFLVKVYEDHDTISKGCIYLKKPTPTTQLPPTTQSPPIPTNTEGKVTVRSVVTIALACLALYINIE
jgi:hypothetical protein